VTVLRDVTNILRRRCKGKYIFYVQANEIVHEDCLSLLRELPEIWPNVMTFSLPYIQLLGTIKFTEEFRLRFAKNLNFIEAVDDAWTLGLSRRFIVKQIIKSLFAPSKLAYILGRGVQRTYANVPTLKLTRAIYLPKPIFRYYSIFPLNFLKKLENHIKLFGDLNWSEAENLLKKGVSTSSSKEFFVKAIDIIRHVYLSSHLDVPNYPYSMSEIPLENHPKIIRSLLRRVLEQPSNSAYSIRDEVMDAIRNG
jgi:hypothetical protein